jgi:hypothetical protein
MVMVNTAAKKPSGAAGGNGDAPDGEVPSPPVRPAEGRMDKIARRAHEIYQARGGAHGKAIEDWLQAEREVDAEMEGS